MAMSEKERQLIDSLRQEMGTKPEEQRNQLLHICQEACMSDEATEALLALFDEAEREKWGSGWAVVTSVRHMLGSTVLNELHPGPKP